MPKWLTEMNAETCLLWLYAMAYGVAVGASPEGEGLPKRAELVSNLALPLVLALWVQRDAQRRSRPLCHDFGAFVFFAWPLIVPIYLFQTRGVRAFLSLLWFGGLLLVMMFVAMLVFVLRDFLWS
jgi:hypothetical protein